MIETCDLHRPFYIKDPENKEANEHLAINLIFKSKSDGQEESKGSQIIRHHPWKLPRTRH